jgi:hypothetical protein
MADYLKSPVFSSPSYWIALGVGVLGIGAAAVQEGRKGSGSAARVHRGSGVAYNVYLRGKLIDTVFQSGMSTVDEVKRSLINHDGYDPAIRVTKAARSSGSGSMADMHGAGGMHGSGGMHGMRGGSMSRNVKWKLISYELSVELNKDGDEVMGRGGRPKRKVTGEYVLGSEYLPENPTQKEIVSKLGAYGVPDLMVITSKTGDVIEVGHKDMPGARLTNPFVRLERQY